MSQKIREKIDFLLSREKGTVYKDPGGRITIALVYPNTYHVGMSNLGFQGIYGLLNGMPNVVCERAFLPDERDIEEYARTNTELFSMESKRPLNRFDIIAFSVSFENDYPNILKVLDLSRLPRRSSERGPRHPLIIMGGVCAFFNPEPVADFFDVCFIGEAEETLPEFLGVFGDASDKAGVLRESLHIDGIYVPGLYTVSYDAEGKISGRSASAGAPQKVGRRRIEDISSSKITTAIVTPETEFSEMFLIEAMRGCPWSCRFCVAGKIYAPPRRKSLAAVEEEVRSALSKTGRIGIIGPSLSDYPHAREILKIPGVDFSVTSLRASSKSAEMVGLIKGRRSVSIAPEAGTGRLRKVINKMISEEDIIHTSELLFAEGVRNLRLYFMVGLPTETREDVAGIVELARKIRNISPKGNLTLSVSTFVPKPFTPFQWHPMEAPHEVRERLKMIKKELTPLKGIRVFHDVPKYAYMQGLFALGDRRVSKVVEGFCEWGDWTKAADKAGVDKDFYIFRAKALSEVLPWDFIEIGTGKDRLWEEYRRALAPY